MSDPDLPSLFVSYHKFSGGHTPVYLDSVWPPPSFPLRQLAPGPVCKLPSQGSFFYISLFLRHCIYRKEKAWVTIHILPGFGSRSDKPRNILVIIIIVVKYWYVLMFIVYYIMIVPHHSECIIKHYCYFIAVSQLRVFLYIFLAD